VTLTRSKQFQAAAIAAIGMPLLEALGSTYTWREQGAEHFDAIARQGRAPILALWHSRIMAATLYFRDRDVVAVTSESFDGEWIARLMRKFGYGAARGSTSRGGVRALVQLRRDLRSGLPAAFTVDGPRGPARVAQAGAVWLASATGNPIVPFHIEASSFWTARSWDAHQVPRPGSALGIAIGEPIAIVPGADAAQIEAGRQFLERALKGLEARALALVRREDA
jgi:lysophospholipid acyltransferase (LPLAT)-like uncharacterized protein